MSQYNCPVHGVPMTAMYDAEPTTERNKVAFRCDRCYCLWDFVQDGGKWVWTEVKWPERDRRDFYVSRGKEPPRKLRIIVPGRANAAAKPLVVPHG